MGAMIQISSVTDLLDNMIEELMTVADWSGQIPADKVKFRLKDLRDRLYEEAYPDRK